MVDGSFVIEDRRERDLMVLRLCGLWDGDTARRFVADLEAVGIRRGNAGLAPRCPRTLIDVRRHGVQTGDVVAVLQRCFESRADPGRRIAMLADGLQL